MAEMTAVLPEKTFIVQPEVWSRLNPRATGSRRADLVRARKVHDCKACARPIVPDEHYYAVVIPGAGLASIKQPERTHVDCMDEARNKAAYRVPVHPDQFPESLGGPIVI